jgi:hypothetical protein
MKEYLKCSTVAFLILIFSCTNKSKKYFTADIDFTCTHKEYFDTLQTFLLTNDKSDVGGESNRFTSLFGASRIYKKNIVKRNGHFFIDSIENNAYWLLFIECKFVGGSFHGFLRNLDFSNNRLDTLTLNVCVEPNAEIISQ